MSASQLHEDAYSTRARVAFTSELDSLPEVEVRGFVALASICTSGCANALPEARLMNVESPQRTFWLVASPVPPAPK